MAYKTQMTTGKVRFSYMSVFEPKTTQSGALRYSVTLLIPKKDKKTLSKINSAIEEAKTAYASRGKSAAGLKGTLHDGDGGKPRGGNFSPECAGHYVMTVSSKDQPVIIDSDRKPLTSRKQLWSGCYGRAVIQFYVYDGSGGKGVTAELMGVMKLYDGEPLGVGVVTDEDWDDEFDDIDDDDYDPLA